MPIGIYHEERPFTNHELPFQEGDMIYLFSDGFTSQNCEDGNKTFTKNNFKKLLLEINRESSQRQKEILTQRLEEWKGSAPQRDDILVMGIRI